MINNKVAPATSQSVITSSPTVISHQEAAQTLNNGIVVKIAPTKMDFSQKSFEEWKQEDDAYYTCCESYSAEAIYQVRKFMSPLYDFCQYVWCTAPQPPTKD